ncbi:2-oxoglutarate and iron-dependent oxygenase domain-containing protein 2 isoform X1 [Numida meleagris]|uniref:2-oxoglutarate and iron-dependent oxygenase domain-containing protein 2 isoform X1 n=2 Tax=Numida meleagris TaxID=8996 RepID=UPI000B3DAC33|nr:2-oxoglutarate and iron-dependent oxygenase domain-containing protein 2 isoform X1 [Numida meleagris]
MHEVRGKEGFSPPPISLFFTPREFSDAPSRAPEALWRRTRARAPAGNMAAGRPFRACACFFSANIFVRRCGMHVCYRDEQQLRRDYGRALRERGCGSEEQMAAVLREIEAEVQRRKQLVHQSAERKAIISQCYKRKHSEVYTLQDSFLAPDFLDMVRYCISPDANLHGLLRYTESFSDKRIYRLPVFTEEFCQAFIEELENFEQSDMPRGRPNSMNNYGVLLNELGMDENFITPLREKYLRPITALLYPDLGGACLDSHKAFVVKYSLHEDLDLSSHYDNAEVTLNVSLGKDFTEGNLYFGDFRQDPSPVPNYIEVEHVRTQGLLHRGGQIHGALPIASGERWNLIIWMRSSAIRNQLCPMCNQKPQLVEAEGFGDGFTETCQEDVPETVDLCSVW